MPGKTTVNATIQPGEEIAIGHTAAQAAEYRAVTEQARHRQASGLPPASQAAPVTAAPGGATEALLSVRDARDMVNRHWDHLKDRAAGIEKELARPVFGLSGQQVPHLIGQQAAARQELGEIRDTMAHIEKILDDDHAVVQYAAGHPAAQRVRGGYVR